MGRLRYKLEEIEEIKRRPIFQLLEDDYAKYKQKYKGIVETSKLLPYYLQPAMICMQMAEGNIAEFERLYNDKDIVEIWELYSIQKATFYQNPDQERIKEN